MVTGCRLVLPEMVARRRGHIVNIASVAGMLAVPGQALYAGTKFAIVGLSTALADEFARSWGASAASCRHSPTPNSSPAHRPVG